MTSKKPKLVTTPWSAERPSGVTLAGDLHSLASPPSKHVIVFAHGVLSSRDHNFTPDLTEALVAATGHTVLRFDFRFAPSELEPSFRYRFCGFEDDLDDLCVVLRKLRAEGYLPYALVGHSRGANDVLMLPGRPEAADVLYGGSTTASAPAAAAAGAAAGSGTSADAGATGAAAPPPWPLAVVALSARFYMPAMFTRLFADDTRATVESTGSAVWPSKRGDLLVTADDAAVVRERMDMAAEVAAMPPRVPVLLFHGTEDEIIPVDDARAFKDLRPSIDLHVVEGARHAFMGKPALRYVLATTTAFIVAQATAFGIPLAPFVPPGAAAAAGGGGGSGKASRRAGGAGGDSAAASPRTPRGAPAAAAAAASTASTTGSGAADAAAATPPAPNAAAAGAAGSVGEGGAAAVAVGSL